jgi:hypothetical protein
MSGRFGISKPPGFLNRHSSGCARSSNKHDDTGAIQGRRHRSITATGPCGHKYVRENSARRVNVLLTIFHQLASHPRAGRRNAVGTGPLSSPMFALGKTLIRNRRASMSAQITNIGFTASLQRRPLLMAELIATVALIISIAVAAAAVSMGIANAEVPFLALG